MAEKIRTMIVMDAGAFRFQFRSGALIWSHGHILIHRGVGDPFWALPGGRVEFHESGEETLAREIEEEIGCRATIGPLRFVIENFFELDGRKTHEIGFYFDAELSRPLPFHESDIIHRSRDGETDLEFRWILPMREALEEIDLKPAPIRALIEANLTGVQHLVYRDE
ncbi:ADP-ribose pyrophosphatase YjhB, NUDIX family [Rhizobium mongolense subsp. loessense]|uniref:ADP-ribose pyrophosphatase YjhB, NUDIX family n=1 Tax=Rhizobium mongolense subsp. loessense TaxID=158890 RepID=A0A1G4U1X1_9HYPH|nr:NUDIX domain-containing protein [Rhizobium mongolense]SCW86829.1 ADP-ribose pyrophosphatase YjhB, NUDIX family [Rhizobium mongolense subsp. loessense]